MTEYRLVPYNLGFFRSEGSESGVTSSKNSSSKSTTNQCQSHL